MSDRGNTFDFSLKLQLRRLPPVKTRKPSLVRARRRNHESNNDNQGANDDQHESESNGLSEEVPAPVGTDTGTPGK